MLKYTELTQNEDLMEKIIKILLLPHHVRTYICINERMLDKDYKCPMVFY